MKLRAYTLMTIGAALMVLAAYLTWRFQFLSDGAMMGWIVTDYLTAFVGALGYLIVCLSLVPGLLVFRAGYDRL